MHLWGKATAFEGCELPTKNRSHVDAMADYLLPQPIYATELLACVRRDGDVAELALFLRRLAEKRGQGARAVDVDAMMMQFRKLQREVGAIMSKVVYERK